MIILKKYKLLKLLNKGSYGSVFLAESILTKKKVAIKLELKESNILKREGQIYQFLCGHQGIPKMKYYGSNDTHHFLVLPFLGSSLEAKTFSLEQTVVILENMIDIIKYVHSKGILHRDLKPGNFLYENNNIYLIDFGLSKKYIDNEGNHVPLKTEKSLVGSVNFSSINVQKGFEASRRDDLESILYIIIFLLNEDIPWNNCHEKEVLERKQSYTEAPIFSLLSMCQAIKFDEAPDYSKFKIKIENV